MIKAYILVYDGEKIELNKSDIFSYSFLIKDKHIGELNRKVLRFQ